MYTNTRVLYVYNNTHAHRDIRARTEIFANDAIVVRSSYAGDVLYRFVKKNKYNNS